ncbi:hypothetical protein F5Y09DRAFT_283198 [Xylaria sp. FL1042]|nr:hypothetical protein F5Y09DRAFT_283198 [Xylaria sp. FL1042]
MYTLRSASTLGPHRRAQISIVTLSRAQGSGYGRTLHILLGQIPRKKRRHMCSFSLVRRLRVRPSLALSSLGGSRSRKGASTRRTISSPLEPRSPRKRTTYNSALKATPERLGTGGLKCEREHGRIGPYILAERRISIFGLLSFHALNSQRSTLPFYSVLVLADFELNLDKPWDSEWQPGLEGTIAFHAAVLLSLRLWQMKWNDVLDKIDDVLRVRLEHTMHRDSIRKWLFDDNFERSEIYLAMLQILRIFGEYISAVSDDLSLLDELFLGNGFPMLDMRLDELRVMRSNWNSIREFQKKAEETLLNRILRKTEEVKSIRDGLLTQPRCARLTEVY